MISAFIKRIRLLAGSFWFSLILFYSLLLCISLAVAGGASSALFSHTMYEQSIHQVDAAAEQFENSMTVYFDDVSGYIKSFLADERVCKDIRDYSSLTGYAKHSAYTSISAQIGRVLNGNDNISDVLIFNDALQLNCVRDSQGITAKFNSPFLQGLKDDIMSSQRFSVRFLVAQQSDYIYSGSPDSHLLVCFPLRDYRYAEGIPLAAVIFEYKLDRLEKMFHSFAMSDQCRSFLFDADNNLILGALDENESLIPKNHTFSLVENDGKSVPLTRIDIPDTDWHLEYMIRTDVIHSHIHTYLRILLCILLAAVIFEYKLDRLEKMFHSFAMSDQCRSFLFDADNNLILGALDENESLIPKNHTFSLVENDGKSVPLTRIDIPDTDWHLEYMIRTDVIHSHIHTYLRILLCILLAMILLSVVVSVLLGNFFSKPFNRLQGVMERLASGDLSARFHHPERYYSEFIALGNGFNDMAEQLESLLDDMYEASLLQNQAELSAIRSKINPHFFYNALQTISSFAMLDDCDHVQQAVQLLGKQFEYIVYGDKELVPLSLEIAHINNYMEYRNLRREHAVALEYHIPPELMTERISKLIVQPLIENCIKHAFAPDFRNGRIFINAERRGETLHIEVADNGCGISPEQLSAIRESLHITRPDRHIGLSSIHNRLHLRWGNQYGLSVDSTLGRGTVCTLILPILGEEPDDENTNADR